MRKAVGILAFVACGHVDPVPDAPPPAPNPSASRCLLAMSGLGDPTCVLRRDGSVACWGANGQGEIGDGTSTAHLDPEITHVIGATDIATGEFHSCAITANKTAMCWGKNDAGQVGDGTLSRRQEPTPVYMSDTVAQIATGQTHTCARHTDGHVSCWGRAAAGAVGSLGPNVLTPTAVAGIASATQITVGDDITCAISGDRAQCWGDDLVLGDGSLTDRPMPGAVALPEGRVIDIAAGCHRHACALLEDGTAWCWGENAVYQLGNGTQTLSRLPVKVLGNIPFKNITVGSTHACGLDAEGSVWCWGDNAVQQIDDAAAHAPQPRRVVLPKPVDQVEAGCARTCARAGDRVWCWGDDELAATPMPRLVHEIPIPCPAP